MNGYELAELVELAQKIRTRTTEFPLGMGEIISKDLEESESFMESNTETITTVKSSKF